MSAAGDMKVIDTAHVNSPSIQLSHLQPASLYAVSVKPLHSIPQFKYDASRATGRFWTEPEEPPEPTDPEFISSTDTTIKLKVFGSPSENTLLTYQVNSVILKIIMYHVIFCYIFLKQNAYYTSWIHWLEKIVKNTIIQTSYN